jgi:hypothetical protein
VQKAESQAGTPPAGPKGRPYTDVKAEIRSCIGDMDIELLKEYDEGDHWGFWVQAGNFPIMIDNEKGLAYCLIVLQITLTDKNAIQSLNRHYRQQDAKFIYELTRVLTSNRAVYSRIMEGDQVVGYSIVTYLYPFHPGFSIRELDRAIRAVIAVGDVGAAFLKMAIGQTSFDHTPPAGSTEPGSMYE